MTVNPLLHDHRIPGESRGPWPKWVPAFAGTARGRKRAPLVLLLVAIVCCTAAQAHAEEQHCVRAEIVLWGDGRHDDTAALTAWLRGADAVWAASGAPVGAAIAGHSFRLSAAVYVEAGTGRRLDDFRLLWPERGETVSGGTIAAGGDPNAAPVLSSVRIEGGDPGEGVPFEAPDPGPAAPRGEASCATS